MRTATARDSAKGNPIERDNVQNPTPNRAETGQGDTFHPGPGQDDAISSNHRRLDPAQRRRVLEIATQRGLECPSCGARRFIVHDALEMGSIWPDEELGSFMTALTCPDCATPTSIRLHESQLLGN